MSINPWLPIDYKLPTGEVVKKIISDDDQWQIFLASEKSNVLVVKEELANKWLESGVLAEGLLVSDAMMKDQGIHLLSGGKGYTLESIVINHRPNTKSEILAFIEALKATHEIDSEIPLHDAIYCERYSRLLPTYSLTASISDDVIIGSWISGGVHVPVQSYRRMKSLAPWIGADNLKEIADKAGFGSKTKTKNKDKKQSSHLGSKDGFQLAGRPYLENFFNEHVIDIVENKERYAALGIEFPSAIILHGPPGCGKTFAVERLVDYLDWPNYQIEASSVASPYIHETSKKVAEVFETAMENAPSVLVIDEMEAFLSERQSSAGGGNHHVEEVAEFLRRIPEAIKNNVLIIAMTNRIEMIDPAILRRGRFDHIIEVGMASADEVHSLLTKLFSEIPHNSNIDINTLAQSLVGRPLSDVAFIVREGARLAAKSGKSEIANEDLLNALSSTVSRTDENKPRGIGFVLDDD